MEGSGVAPGSTAACSMVEDDHSLKLVAARSRVLLGVAASAVATLVVLGFATANASARPVRATSLRIRVAGLPASQPSSILITGPSFRRSFRRQRIALARLRPGRYVVKVRPVRISGSRRRIARGSVAYPARPRLVMRVRRGRISRLVIVYAGVVAPNVKPLPTNVLGVVGNPDNPVGLVLPGIAPAPLPGTVFATGPTAMLPRGLIARVTGVAPQGKFLIVSVVSVPVAEATPLITYSGALALAPSAGAQTSVGGVQPLGAAGDVRAGAAAACNPPKLLSYGAHLDSVELRQASLGAWPPQMRLTLAVRTTEHLGVAAAAVGINCDWTLGQLGPYSTAIPVGPIVVPLYVTLPLHAGIHVQGTLNVGQINIASTTVAHVAAGVDENAASLTEQGTNVWFSGGPSLSGTAELSAALGIQGGIGIADGANVHVEADFGPTFSWKSGKGCDLVFNFGSLTAGVTVLGHSLSAPFFKGWKWHIWSGCKPATAGGSGSVSGSPVSGSGSGSGPSSGSGPPSGSGHPGGTPVSLPGTGSISASQGGQYGCSNCSALNIAVHSFGPGSYTYYCHDNSGPGGSDTIFYSHAVTVSDPNQGTWPGVFCDDNPPYTAYLVMDGVRSNSVTFTNPAPPPPPAGASMSASQGGQYGCSNCSALNIAVHNFPTGTFTYYCHDNSGPGGSDTIFYSHAVTVSDPNQGTWPGVFCDDNPPYTAYLVMDGVRSNSVTFTNPAPPPPPAGASMSASQGGQYGCSNCSALNIAVHNFPTGTFTYYCHDNSGPGGSDTIFYSHAVTVSDPNQGTWPGVFCDDNPPYTAYLVMDGVRSNSVTFTNPAPPPPPPPPPAASISASKGGHYGCGVCYSLNVQVHNFPTGTFTYYCHDNSGPGGSDTIFYSHAVSITDPNQGTWPGVFCYDSAPYNAYVVINGVASNHVQY